VLGKSSFELKESTGAIGAAALSCCWTGGGVAIEEREVVGRPWLEGIPLHLQRSLRKYEIALVGDFAQLPPVGDTPLYSPPSAATDNGVLGGEESTLHRLFSESFRLQVVHRLGP
jgi:hypothetical protein